MAGATVTVLAPTIKRNVIAMTLELRAKTEDVSLHVVLVVIHQVAIVNQAGGIVKV
jgi:hypothetical protein